MRTIIYTISPDDHGRTVEQYLRRCGLSHALLVQLKRFPDGMLLNGVPVRTIDRLTTGSCLKLTLREAGTNVHITPVNLPCSTVYEDEDLFVIDKPVGMPVHPSQGNRENALANALAAIYESRGEPFVFRAIGRLDKNTSGLVLLAKNALSGCLLSAMLQKRVIRREYLAICRGLLPPSGTINAPIARAPGSTILREVRVDGDNAVTHFKRLSFSNGFSLAHVWLDTGKTHQIRVHMAHIGHPLPGDFLYCPEFSQISRHALHAAYLRFPHPITGKPLYFTSPLPADMAQIMTDRQTRRT